MLGRDAVMWSDRIGWKGETNGSGDANSTAGATVFARAPMVRRMRQSAAAAERPTNARIEKPARPEEAASKQSTRYTYELVHHKAANLLCSNELVFIAESLEYDGR